MSYNELLRSIMGGESATQEVLTATEEKLIGKTAEQVAEDIIDRDIAIAEKATAETIATLESHSDRLETLDGLVCELEDSIDGMEKMNAGGSFNPELFACHYNKAVKISSRFGAKLERHGVESFSSKETAEYTSHSGLESMKDVALKAVEEGKKILVQIWDALISGIKNFVTMFGSVKTKAQAQLDALSEDKLVSGTVTLPSDAYLLYNGQRNDFYKRLVNATKAFGSYIPTENSYETIADTLAGNVGDSGKVVVNKESGSLSVEKNGEGKKEANALGMAGVKSLLQDVIEGVDDLMKGELDVKKLTTQRDKAIAQMGSNAKSEEFVSQKKYGRLSAKLILQAMNLQARILKAQFGVAKANFK